MFLPFQNRYSYFQQAFAQLLMKCLTQLDTLRTARHRVTDLVQFLQASVCVWTWHYYWRYRHPFLVPRAHTDGAATQERPRAILPPAVVRSRDVIVNAEKFFQNQMIFPKTFRLRFIYYFSTSCKEVTDKEQRCSVRWSSPATQEITESRKKKAETVGQAGTPDLPKSQDARALWLWENGGEPFHQNRTRKVVILKIRGRSIQN